MIDVAGVPNRGCTSPSLAKKAPSAAMLWKTRAAVSVRPCAALMIATSTGIATRRAATGPKTAPTDSDATALDCASRSGPSAAR